MDSTLNPSMALHTEEESTGMKIGDFMRYIFATLMVVFSDSSRPMSHRNQSCKHNFIKFAIVGFSGRVLKSC